MSRRTRDGSALCPDSPPTATGANHAPPDQDVAGADLILAMAGEHVAFIRRRSPGAGLRNRRRRSSDWSGIFRRAWSRQRTG